MKQLILPFKSLWQFVAVTLISSTLINIFFWSGTFEGIQLFLIGTVWSSLIWVTQWIGNVYIGIQIEKKYSWLEKPKQRFIVGLVSIILYSSLAYMIVQTSMYYIFLGGVPKDYFSWISMQVLFIAPISTVIAFTFTSVGFFMNWKKSVINAQKLETEMLRYKYESLQNQINPHFLFNSFNVLTELIDENKELAIKFVQEMSGLYRYVLESKEKELVLLSEELNFNKKYIFMLETRFEQKVIFNLNIKDENEYIVPMALQLLIENSAKHNIATTKKKLLIDIYKEDNFLVVKNNLQLKTSQESSTKTGLKNLKQQYSFFTKKEVITQITDNDFIV